MTTIVVVDGLTITETMTFSFGNRFSSEAVATEIVSAGGSLYHIGVASGMESNGIGTEVVSFRRLFSVTGDAVAESIEEVRRVLNMQGNAVASSTVLAPAKAIMSFAEAARASDSVNAPRTISLVSSAVASDSHTAQRILSFVESALAVSSIQSTIKMILRSNAIASGELTEEARRSIAFSSSAVATGALLEALRIVTVVESSSAVASSTVTNKRYVEVEFASDAVAASLVQPVVTAQMSFEANAEAEDHVRLPAESMPALWFNTTTAAAATWDGMPFNSMLEVDGEVFGASVDGISRVLPKEKDGTEKIDWHVYWDLMDFEVPARKRVGNVYVVGYAEKSFNVFVINRQGSFTYLSKLPKGEHATNYRATPGKGLDSAFYRIGVGGSGYGEVKTVIVDINPTTRRI